MSALDGVVVEALVIILALGASRWFNRHRHAALAGEPLGAPPDPYAIAWLAGGPAKVLQLTVYDLVRRGRLALAPAGPAGAARSPTPQLVPVGGRDGEAALPEAARRLLELVAGACDHPRLAGFARDLAPGFDALERSIRADGLLLSPAQRAAGWTVTALGMAAVLGVACWQLQGAQGGLAVVCLAGIGVAALRLLGAPEPRLSPRGRAYLVRLAGADAGAAARQHAAQRWTPVAGEQDQGAPAPAPGLLEFACSTPLVLNGTAYAWLVALLDPACVLPGPPAVPESSEAEDGDGRPSPGHGAQR